MPFDLWINRKRYTVGAHAAKRMMQRAISEDMIIRTMEEGSINELYHSDLYEHAFYDEALGEMFVIRVVVDEQRRFIRTVIDLSDQDDDDID
jgi:hypothetical protein